MMQTLDRVGIVGSGQNRPKWPKVRKSADLLKIWPILGAPPDLARFARNGHISTILRPPGGLPGPDLEENDKFDQILGSEIEFVVFL